MSGRIDVHAHFLTPRYRAAVEAAGHGRPDGMPGLPPWSPELALGVMDRLGVERAILSVSSPGVHFGDVAAARALCRAVNEEGAALVADHPGRFGLFAETPLPDVEATLQEVAFALDVLKADGVALKTNHAGHYLGDPLFEPLFEELDRRSAVVFIHPTSPCCAGCVDLAMGYPRPLIEFFFETTRAVTNLILTGTLRRFPQVRVIVPHAGAALPMVAERIAELAPIMGLARPVGAADVYDDLRRLHYDTAGFAVPAQLDALMRFADPARLLYGSDWPYTPEPFASEALGRLQQTDLLQAQERQALFRDNALRLLSR